MKISCIIPAYNESAHIHAVVTSVYPFVNEVIVVDDASSDNTALLATAAGAIVKRHPLNRGQGAALETGNQYALQNGADIIIHFDADNQFVASEIPDIIQPLINGQADIVFGSRFLGKKSNLPFIKKFIIYPLAQIFTRYFLGIKLSDPQNGFRAMNRRAANLIKITNREMAHASEIQVIAFKNKLKIAEVPITVIYHHFGQKLSGGFKVIKDLLISRLIK